MRFGLIMFLMFAVNASGNSLETIREQFGIYQRLPGEIEILATNNTQEIDNVLKRTEAKRQAVRKELNRALTNIEPNNTAPDNNLPSPFFAEDYIAPFIHYVAVEQALALRSLEQARPNDAVESVRYVYRLADVLSHSGSLELCAAAARFRMQMLETAQAILLHPTCLHEHHKQLHAIFYTQIENRIPDDLIWIRYRDEGKRFFSQLGTKPLDKIVSPNVLEELIERDAFREYVGNNAKTRRDRAVHDQSVFLGVLGAVIEACSVPYFQRQPVLRQLEQELRTHRSTPTEPVFALLLLRDVTRYMQLFAQERSGIELAYLALSAALGDQDRNRKRNFFTGNEYELRLITNGVMSTYQGNIKPFYVPYR